MLSPEQRKLLQIANLANSAAQAIHDRDEAQEMVTTGFLGNSRGQEEKVRLLLDLLFTLTKEIENVSH